MAAKKGKKTGKPMGKKEMKKTKGGAVDAFLKIEGVQGQSIVSPRDPSSFTFGKI